MHFVQGGAEDTWVRSALWAGAWDRWLGNVAWVLQVPLPWVENRLLKLMLWGVELTRDFGIFPSELQRALDLLEPEVWLSLVHDSTSPRVVLLRIREELLHWGPGAAPGC